MRIKLTEERQKLLSDLLRRKYSEAFDETLSDFRVQALLELLLETVGPVVYNQAVQDVRQHLQGKLDDLDGEVYADGELTV